MGDVILPSCATSTPGSADGCVLVAASNVEKRCRSLLVYAKTDAEFPYPMARVNCELVVARRYSRLIGFVAEVLTGKLQEFLPLRLVPSETKRKNREIG